MFDNHSLLKQEFEDCFSLVIVRSAGDIALGRKTRGYGASRLVLPGGKDLYYLGCTGMSIAPGPVDASKEVAEELGLDIVAQQVGVLHISTEDDIKRVSVFDATSQNTSLTASDELSTPAWHPTDSLPYHEMPSDYSIWLPHILAGYTITAILESHMNEVVAGTVIRQRLEPLGRAERVVI